MPGRWRRLADQVSRGRGIRDVCLCRQPDRGFPPSLLAASPPGSYPTCSGGNGVRAAPLPSGAGTRSAVRPSVTCRSPVRGHRDWSRWGVATAQAVIGEPGALGEARLERSAGVLETGLGRVVQDLGDAPVGGGVGEGAQCAFTSFSPRVAGVHRERGRERLVAAAHCRSAPAQASTVAVVPPCPSHPSRHRPPLLRRRRDGRRRQRRWGALDSKARSNPGRGS